MHDQGTSDGEQQGLLPVFIIRREQQALLLVI